MFVSAIIAAAGRGVRFGGDRPKQLVTVAGRPILERAVRAFMEHSSVSEVIVALPADIVVDPPAYLTAGAKPLRLVAGGPRRQDSVASALEAASPMAEVIVVHDAARPFASPDLIARTIAAAREEGAAVAAVPSRDTVKLVEGSRVKSTLSRETVYLAQTPQAFRAGLLRAALASGAEDVTDEASLVERAGHAVRVVEGDPDNIKITTAADLPVAEAIAEKRDARHSVTQPARTGRAGTGYDLHRLVAGRPLVLGGVTIPSARGALGHSDADVVCHAMTDAILGAAGLGDIGRHFPDSDPRWKDASSLDLLSRAAAMVREHGFEVGNIDTTVVLEAPRIGAYVDDMRNAVSRALGVDLDRVSIKAKTNEGVDALGRGEAIAAHAIALIRRIAE